MAIDNTNSCFVFNPPLNSVGFLQINIEFSKMCFFVRQEICFVFNEDIDYLGNLKVSTDD